MHGRHTIVRFTYAPLSHAHALDIDMHGSTRIRTYIIQATSRRERQHRSSRESEDDDADAYCVSSYPKETALHESAK